MDNQIIVFFIQIIISGLVGFFAAVYKLGKYEEKVNTLESKVKTLETDSKGLSRELAECSTKIDERTQSYSATLTKRKSPVTLTDKGEELLKRSGSDKFVLENKDELINKIKEKNPKTAYDIQLFAREIIEGLQNEDRFNQFKNFVYKEGIDLETIFIVMSIYLRDIALPLLGYKPEQIDETDPTTNQKTS